MNYPHTPNCPDCEKTRVCNYCGKPMDAAAWSHRCTQGRCSECHGRRCTPGGATSPGHGSGLAFDEVARAYANECADHGRNEAALREWCPICNAPPGTACVAFLGERRVAAPAPFLHAARRDRARARPL